MVYNYDRAVVIGRFSSFFHRGHEMLIYKALQTAETVAVVFGSSHCYPNTVNPLPTPVRIRMFKEWMSNNLTPSEQARIVFGNVPDYRYNEDRWQTEVREAAQEQPGERVAMIAYDKDEEVLLDQNLWMGPYSMHGRSESRKRHLKYPNA